MMGYQNHKCQDIKSAGFTIVWKFDFGHLKKQFLTCYTWEHKESNGTGPGAIWPNRARIGQRSLMYKNMYMTEFLIKLEITCYLCNEIP